MKRTVLIICLVFSIFFSTALCHAQQKHPVLIKAGFLTGNSFRDLTYAGKLGYAMGFVDGLLMSPTFGALEEELKFIVTCVVGMSNEQVVAIFDKFLSENPARWHQPMNILAWVAMKDSCKK